MFARGARIVSRLCNRSLAASSVGFTRPLLCGSSQMTAIVQTRAVSSELRTKVASVRLTKKYKKKNHKGAIKRWIPMPNGNFLRKKAGLKANGKRIRCWKRKKNRRLVLANPTQRRLLRKLIPYHSKVRRTYGGVDIYRKWKHLVE